MPISFFEGIRPQEREELQRKNLHSRFYALAAAVRDHENSARRSGLASDPRDEHLYRRLRELCGEPPSREHPAA